MSLSLCSSCGLAGIFLSWLLDSSADSDRFQLFITTTNTFWYLPQHSACLSAASWSRTVLRVLFNEEDKGWISRDRPAGLNHWSNNNNNNNLGQSPALLSVEQKGSVAISWSRIPDPCGSTESERVRVTVSSKPPSWRNKHISPPTIYLPDPQKPWTRVQRRPADLTVSQQTGSISPESREIKKINTHTYPPVWVHQSEFLPQFSKDGSVCLPEWMDGALSIQNTLLWINIIRHQCWMFFIWWILS